jgi:nucleotide-binding universal stress UspA family protein
MTIDATPRFVLLAAVDASETSDRVISAALGLANVVDDAEIHIVHVVDQLSVASRARHAVAPPTHDDMLGPARALLRRHQGAAQAALPGLRVVTHLSIGTPWQRVVDLGAQLQADMILVGAHDYSALQRLLLGSVATTIVKKASCPVLVVRAKEFRASDVPEIAPPCPVCVAVQNESRGATLWCDRHGEHHPKAHLHYEYPEPFAVGSSLLRP